MKIDEIISRKYEKISGRIKITTINTNYQKKITIMKKIKSLMESYNIKVDISSDLFREEITINCKNKKDLMKTADILSKNEEIKRFIKYLDIVYDIKKPKNDTKSSI